MIKVSREVIYDWPMGLRQFFEITFASFATLKYDMKLRTSVRGLGSPDES